MAPRAIARLTHPPDDTQERSKFQRLGIDPPRGVLLYGPPGTGKTALATAVAEEAASEANFISVQGTELLNAVVGSSERAIARLFAQARACAPCLLLIDQVLQAYLYTLRDREGNEGRQGGRKVGGKGG